MQTVKRRQAIEFAQEQIIQRSGFIDDEAEVGDDDSEENSEGDVEAKVEHDNNKDSLSVETYD